VLCPCLCGIIRLTNFASLLKFESHYPPLCGIIRPANFSALCF
jgi:hypothetical protein